MDGNRKLFWKEVGKVGRCYRVKYGDGRLAVGKDKMQRTWNDYFSMLLFPYELINQPRIRPEMSPEITTSVCRYGV